MNTVRADCDCGRTDPANPCTGSSASRVLGGNTITFEFNADGEDCQCGRFVNGEVWVVPVTAAGRRVSGVTITAMTPAGENNAAESNPDHPTQHGILTGWSGYDASRNVMTKLPYLAQPGESIIKSVDNLPSSDCLTSATQTNGCVSAFDVITVLDSVPPDNGSTIFRPPYAGTEKPLRSINSVHFERLPRLANISANPYQSTFASIVAKWNSPQYELTHATGEKMRGSTPMDVLGSDYAASTAQTYLGNLLSVFGTESNAEKAAAVYALMQPGFDNYGVYKIGIPFGSGAGQHLGKKPTIVFAAAMYDDQQMLDDIRAASSRLDTAWFQEDEQVFTVPGQSTTPVWGNRDDGTGASGNPHWYWHTLFLRWADGVENKRTLGDWHGYIDGPGGGAENISYQWIATGPFAAFALAMHLMPWMEYANNDQEILDYSDRVWNGRGIDDFTGGWWGAPDPCAPVDPRESLDCEVKSGGASGCQYYQVTWGPDPANLSDCIKHNGDPYADGRYTDLHGKSFPPTTWNRLPKIALTSWQIFRDCTDPNDPSYPCDGMGPEVGSTAADVPAMPEPSSGISVRPYPVKNNALFIAESGAFASGAVIEIYSGDGSRQINSLQADIPGVISWDGTDLAGRTVNPGMYYYIITNGSETSAGRLVKVAE